MLGSVLSRQSCSLQSLVTLWFQHSPEPGPASSTSYKALLAAGGGREHEGLRGSLELLRAPPAPSERQ